MSGRKVMMVRHAEGIHNMPLPAWVAIVAAAAVVCGVGTAIALYLFGYGWVVYPAGIGAAFGGASIAQLFINRERRKRWQYVDPRLSAAGVSSVQRFRERRSKDVVEQDIVVVSPMRRTLQTATLMFEDYKNTPIVALELCREVLQNPCDKRDSIAVLRKEFPRVDFSAVSSDADPLGDGDDPAARAQEVAKHLREGAHPFTGSRQITVVSHMNFIRELMTALGRGGRPLMNLETRTVDLEAEAPASQPQLAGTEPTAGVQ